jgi:hypothetical protein
MMVTDKSHDLPWPDGFLLDIWIKGGRQREPDVSIGDWPEDLADLLRLTDPKMLKRFKLSDGTRLDRILSVVPAKDSPIIALTHDDVPSISSVDEHGKPLMQETRATFTFSFSPEGIKKLQALDLECNPKEKPGPKTHATQLTRTLEDGTKLVLDTRNLSGAVLSTPERAARSCLYWLDVFKDPENPGQKTKMRMNLERADALWGRELEQQDPGLYLRIMQVLGHPGKAALNPLLVLDDREAGF